MNAATPTRAWAEPLAQARTSLPSGTSRLLTGDGTDPRSHRARWGAPRWREAALIAQVTEAGLSGRGGAGFPSARKLTTVAQGRDAIVIANASEGEPASWKDAVLLSYAPHLVLDGLQLAAEAVNASEVWLAVHPGPAADSARAALKQRSQAPSDLDLRQVQIHLVEPGFISGEETALISAIGGGPAMPTFKEHLAVHRGLRDRPTLVQNAETLAHIATIARGGADWFREQGTAEDPGTFLASIGGSVANPGVVELARGTTIRDALTATGGAVESLRALLIGGYHGTWITAAEGIDAPLSKQGLAPWGGSVGAGVLIALPESACGLLASAQIATYLAGESAGQCGPCLNGLPAVAEALNRLAGGDRDPRLGQQIEWLADITSGRGVCAHPDGSLRMVRSALRAFADDVAAHRTGRCLAVAGVGR
jgi:NADH:ubiquinone oxidoreductase subunit F (NADH-binding)